LSKTIGNTESVLAVVVEVQI